MTSVKGLSGHSCLGNGTSNGLAANIRLKKNIFRAANVLLCFLQEAQLIILLSKMTFYRAQIKAEGTNNNKMQ